MVVNTLISDTDRHIGARVRERRILLGMSQQQLADAVGITYQQQHKYERGINRVAAARLYQIAEALGVPAAYFFDGLRDGAPAEPGAGQRQALELARNFAAITNPSHREALAHMGRVLAAGVDLVEA